MMFTSLVVFITLSLEQLHGFAFAPNFITKIISEDTQLEPNGLLQIHNENEEDAAISNNDTNEPSNNVNKVSTVRTRFPPEPNGYLHLGHAKSITFNFAVANVFGGSCHMRMDDTNPSKEDKEYVNSILEDVQWLQSGLYEEGSFPWDGNVKKTSDYFEFIYECAEALIENGYAYVDSLSADEMRDYRGTLTTPGRNSPDRDRPVEENLQLFQDMRNGKYNDGEYTVRAKIAMDSPNINLRDPTLYRIKHETHPETHDAWCIYPMYDFSHPIADAVEQISHSLCTLEFEDHRPFYDWTITTLKKLGKLTCQPQQIEFSRLNMQSTVLSKRKLIQLVQEKIVTGWDDPRLPTISGIRRRGVPATALRLFCERIGISKSDSNIAMNVLEDCVRETMDPVCERAMAVLQPLKVTMENYDDTALEYFTVDRHPKITSMGTREIPFGKSIYIERSDFFDTEGPEGSLTNGKPPKGFKRLLPNGSVRLRYAYVIECTKVVRDPDTKEPTELICRYIPETRAGVTPDGMKRVNGIIHWVEQSTAVPCTIYQYDRLFMTEEPGKESGDFLQDVNPDSLTVLEKAIVEPSVAQDAANVLKDIENNVVKYASSLAYQFERNGYFALDSSSSKAGLAFNRVVTLRDTWGKAEVAPSKPQKQATTGSPAEDVLRPAFCAATILSASAHPEADTLLVCEVDCGDTDDDGALVPRTVVAGLAGSFEPDELVCRKVVVVANLKPARMRGIESTAMILAASKGEGENPTVELLDVPKDVGNGDLFAFDGKPMSQPDEMMKSKGAVKAWERVKNCLHVDAEGRVVYREGGEDFVMTSTHGSISCRSLVDADVK